MHDPHRPERPAFEPQRATTPFEGEAAPASADELSLCRRILAGERAAASELVERELDALYEFVHWRLGGERSETEDVVQDTFALALESLPRFEGRSSLHSWICGIARNKLRERRRRENRRRARPIDELLEEADPEIDRILAQVERTPLPEWALERDETRELVGAVLSSLPPDYRQALVAKYVEELSVAEIARRQGRSESAAESQLQRARSAFARIFTLLARRRGELE